MIRLLMSGGLAFVYDADGTFSRRVNPEMVDLDPLDDDDRGWLRERIALHRSETDSAVAQRMLAAWPSEAERFVKVMPRDYKRVLAAIAQAEAEGTDVDTAVMAAAEG